MFENEHCLYFERVVSIYIIASNIGRGSQASEATEAIQRTLDGPSGPLYHPRFSVTPFVCIATGHASFSRGTAGKYARHVYYL